MMLTDAQRTARLTEARTRRAAFVNAEMKILVGGQSVTFEDRTLTRADLKYISKMITDLTNEVTALENGTGIQVQAVIPSDI